MRRPSRRPRGCGRRQRACRRAGNGSWGAISALEKRARRLGVGEPAPTRTPAVNSPDLERLGQLRLHPVRARTDGPGWPSCIVRVTVRGASDDILGGCEGALPPRSACRLPDIWTSRSSRTPPPGATGRTALYLKPGDEVPRPTSSTARATTRGSTMRRTRPGRRAQTSASCSARNPALARRRDPPGSRACSYHGRCPGSHSGSSTSSGSRSRRWHRGVDDLLRISMRALYETGGRRAAARRPPATRLELPAALRDVQADERAELSTVLQSAGGRLHGIEEPDNRFRFAGRTKRLPRVRYGRACFMNAFRVASS